MVTEEPKRRGRPPSCLCGECKKCRNRLRMREWNANRTPEEKKAAYARKDKEKQRVTDRARYARNRDARLEDQKAYRQSMAGRAARERAQKKYRKGHPEKRAAHNAVNSAVRNGRLAKESCLFCDSPDTHGHHHDYSRPLDVTWLCDRHHKLAHGRTIKVKVN